MESLHISGIYVETEGENPKMMEPMLYFYHVNHYHYLNNTQSGFTIGRNSGDLIIPDSGLSGKHAQFIIEQDENGMAIYVIDLGSKNRTAVNRTEIMPNNKVLLQDGALVELGGQSFIITSNKNLTFEKVNALLDTHRAKPIVKLESVKAVIDLKERIKEELGKLASTEIALQAEITIRENSIQQVMQELSSLDKKLEEAKARLIAETQEQKYSLNEQLKTIKSEIVAFTEKKEKIRAEIEKKKPKFSGTKVPEIE